MKYVLTNAQMRAADKYTIEEVGEPSLALMERAGIALADEAETIAPRGRIVCVCGGGNNGGDGFVCARQLLKRDRDVEAVFLPCKTSPECEINRSEFEMLGGKIGNRLPEGKIALVVDCLFGTGFHGELDEKAAELVLEINALKARGVKILSADVPSGVNGENGFAARETVEADVTLCIGELKTGVFLNDGIDFSGTPKRADIGIFLPHVDEYAQLVEREDVRKLLPKRKRNSHKGTYGKAAIVAGSDEYSGAAYLAVKAALRSGVGYTALFTPEAVLPHYLLKAPEALLEPLNEGGRVAFNEENFEKLLSYDAIAYGMGMGLCEDAYLGVKYLLENYTGKLILDADALNALAKFGKAEMQTLFEKKRCFVVMTPHIKEFSRISDLTVTEILSAGAAAAKPFAKAYGVTVLLKNAVTTVTDGEKVYLSIAGTAGQAKGGSGDALSGVIAGLCASGLSVTDGAIAGAYLAGTAAEFAAREYGEYSLLATDVIEKLGAAFLSLSK